MSYKITMKVVAHFVALFGWNHKQYNNPYNMTYLSPYQQQNGDQASGHKETEVKDPRYRSSQCIGDVVANAAQGMGSGVGAPPVDRSS